MSSPHVSFLLRTAVDAIYPGYRRYSIHQGMSDTCSVSLPASADLNLLLPDKSLDQFVTVFLTWSCLLVAKKICVYVGGFLTFIRKTFFKD